MIDTKKSLVFFINPISIAMCSTITVHSRFLRQALQLNIFVYPHCAGAFVVININIFVIAQVHFQSHIQIFLSLCRRICSHIYKHFCHCAGAFVVIYIYIQTFLSLRRRIFSHIYKNFCHCAGAFVVIYTNIFVIAQAHLQSYIQTFLSLFTLI